MTAPEPAPPAHGVSTDGLPKPFYDDRGSMSRPAPAPAAAGAVSPPPCPVRDAHPTCRLPARHGQQEPAGQSRPAARARLCAVWPRLDGLRALELGVPGGSREALNGLVLSGRKRATAGLLQEYEQEGEVLEHVGERLALVGDDGRALTVVEITDVQVRRFADVPWEFAAAEGEGDEDLAQWRAGHRRFWAAQGTPVDADTAVVCLSFVLCRSVGPH
jgi:uncharacterized protein YhfF